MLNLRKKLRKTSLSIIAILIGSSTLFSNTAQWVPVSFGDLPVMVPIKKKVSPLEFIATQHVFIGEELELDLRHTDHNMGRFHIWNAPTFSAELDQLPGVASLSEAGFFHFAPSTEAFTGFYPVTFHVIDGSHEASVSIEIYVEQREPQPEVINTHIDPNNPLMIGRSAPPCFYVPDGSYQISPCPGWNIIYDHITRRIHPSTGKTAFEYFEGLLHTYNGYLLGEAGHKIQGRNPHSEDKRDEQDAKREAFKTWRKVVSGKVLEFWNTRLEEYNETYGAWYPKWRYIEQLASLFYSMTDPEGLSYNFLNADHYQYQCSRRHDDKYNCKLLAEPRAGTEATHRSSFIYAERESLPEFYEFALFIDRNDGKWKGYNPLTHSKFNEIYPWISTVNIACGLPSSAHREDTFGLSPKYITVNGITEAVEVTSHSLLDALIDCATPNQIAELFPLINSTIEDEPEPIQPVRILTPESGGGCLDVYEARLIDNTWANVVYANCHGGPNQLWWFDGNYIRGFYGKCLEEQEAAPGEAPSVIITNCNGGERQKWNVRITPTHAPTIQSQHSGRCVEAQPNTPTGQVRNVITANCHYADWQKWHFDVSITQSTIAQLDPIDVEERCHNNAPETLFDMILHYSSSDCKAVRDTYISLETHGEEFINPAPSSAESKRILTPESGGGCLDVYGSHLNNTGGALDQSWGNVVYANCHDGANQMWWFDGTYIRGFHGKCLEERYAELALPGDPPNVVVASCDGGENQKWNLITTPTHAPSIQSRDSHRCIEAQPNPPPGTTRNVITATCNQANWQKWYFDGAAL